MCRHLAYLGPPATLATLLLEPPHSLRRQSYAPGDMRGGGTINADGFGAAWYPAGAAEPVRYRSEKPIWTDTGFAALAGATAAPAVLAAVRSATVGMPVSVSAAAPFVDGRFAFSHNGMVRGWPDTVAGLATELPVTDLMTLEAPTDAALLWALVRHRLRAGKEPGEALADVVAAVAAAAPGSRLNLLLTDGTGIWATTCHHALSVRVLPDADPVLGPASGPWVVVASEPLDELPGWTEVPDRHLLVARPGHHDRRPLTPLGDP